MKIKRLNIQKMSYLLLLVIISSSFLQCRNLLDLQPDWNDDLNFEEIEERMKNETIVKTKNLEKFIESMGREYAGRYPLRLVVFQSGLLAVFKEADECYGEIAAYKASKKLGLRLVPPTVLREVYGKKGSLQFYVKSSFDLLKKGNERFIEKLRPKDTSDRYIFNRLFNQWDDHNSNQIIAKNGQHYYLALIDHEAITTLGQKSKYQKKCTAFYASTLNAIKKLNTESLEEIWSDYLPKNPQLCQRLIKKTLQMKAKILKMAGKECPIIAQ